MPPRIGGEKRKQYLYLRQLGTPITTAAKEVGVSESWAHTYEKDVLTAEQRATIPGRRAMSSKEARDGVLPLDVDELCDRARRSLEDFEMFRRVYLGRVSMPWQIEAGETMRELLATRNREFVVVNCAPGTGKSALFATDIPLWLTVRNRAIRGIIGSRTQNQANAYTGRLKKILERRSPMQAKSDEVEVGLAVDAESALALDFGAFKPPQQTDMWRREQFVVVQFGETPTDEKESTWTAFGQDSGQLGWRVNFIVWDDLVDKKSTKTPEAIETQREWWDDEAETRLEPGGLLVLQGQRISSEDLYRYCKDKPAGNVLELEAQGGDPSIGPRKYHQIIYPAHVESACQGNHGMDAPAYPGHRAPANGGCLAHPIRQPWLDLQRERAGNGGERKFRVLYQQEDTDPSATLVRPEWVAGGRDPESGEIFPGCWDLERRLCELPMNLRSPLISVAVADPSPTKFWAIEWVVYQPATGFRFLMDLERRSMSAPAFLDWNERDQRFTGVMEEWQRRSIGLGVPITWWVIEQNAAQRFILQYDHFRRWQQRTGVRVIGHETHGGNKADAEFGLSASLEPIFRRGLLRLPGFPNDSVSRPASLKLVDEATRYPDVSTDDTLMALWFFEFNKRRFEVPDPGSQPKKQTPDFIRDAA
jgi:hypothetical protein